MSPTMFLLHMSALTAGSMLALPILQAKRAMSASAPASVDSEPHPGDERPVPPPSALLRLNTILREQLRSRESSGILFTLRQLHMTNDGPPSNLAGDLDRPWIWRVPATVSLHGLVRRAREGSLDGAEHMDMALRLAQNALVWDLACKHPQRSLKKRTLEAVIRSLMDWGSKNRPEQSTSAQEEQRESQAVWRQRQALFLAVALLDTGYAVTRALREELFALAMGLDELEAAVKLYDPLAASSFAHGAAQSVELCAKLMDRVRPPNDGAYVRSLHTLDRDTLGALEIVAGHVGIATRLLKRDPNARLSRQHYNLLDVLLVFARFQMHNLGPQGRMEHLRLEHRVESVLAQLVDICEQRNIWDKKGKLRGRLLAWSTQRARLGKATMRLVTGLAEETTQADALARLSMLVAARTRARSLIDSRRLLDVALPMAARQLHSGESNLQLSSTLLHHCVQAGHIDQLDRLVFTLLPEIDVRELSAESVLPPNPFPRRPGLAYVYADLLNLAAKAGRIGIACRIFYACKKTSEESRRGALEDGEAHGAWAVPSQVFALLLQAFAAEYRRVRSRSDRRMKGYGRDAVRLYLLRQAKEEASRRGESLTRDAREHFIGREEIHFPARVGCLLALQHCVADLDAAAAECVRRAWSTPFAQKEAAILRESVDGLPEVYRDYLQPLAGLLGTGDRGAKAIVSSWKLRARRAYAGKHGTFKLSDQEWTAMVDAALSRRGDAEAATDGGWKGA